jgi:hypothetical protein
MSKYENILNVSLAQLFIQEIRETLSFLELQSPFLSSIKTMASSALKMYFVWLFESIKELRRDLDFPDNFNYMAMKEFRNRIVHQPRRWSDESEVQEIRNYAELLAGLVTNPSR